MDYRVDKVYDPKRKEYKRLMSGDEDELLSVLVKTQGAIRSTIKAIYAVYLDIKKEDVTSKNRSISVQIGDDTEIADITDDAPSTISKALNRITAKDQFIKRDYVNLICGEYVTHFKPEALTGLLTNLHKTFKDHKEIEIQHYLRDVMSYQLHVLRENLTTQQVKDPAYTIKYIRGIITSSRSRNEQLINLRERGTVIIKRVSKMNNRYYLVKARIALMLYILLLTY